MNRERILVVEDEEMSRDLLVRLFTSKSYDVDAVPDGPSALAWLEQTVPDLILLDISMPGMSGLDVLAWIRRRRTAEQLPVILVSALINSDDVVAGLEAGANDYVVKPVNPPVLHARVRTCLRIKQDVDRLVDAERHRVMLESLGDACEQLERLMNEVMEQLGELYPLLPAQDEAARVKLTDVINWAGAVSDLIERFRKVSQYRKVPYTEGLSGFVSASLEDCAGGRKRSVADPSRRSVETDG